MNVHTAGVLSREKVGDLVALPFSQVAAKLDFATKAGSPSPNVAVVPAVEIFVRSQILMVAAVEMADIFFDSPFLQSPVFPGSLESPQLESAVEDSLV